MPLTFNPLTGQLDIIAINLPASSTDHAVVRWDGTSGDTIQDSGITIDDSDNLIIPDDAWIGLGSGKGRIEFDDQTIDEINFLDCNVGIGTSTPEMQLHLLKPEGVPTTPEVRLTYYCDATSGLRVRHQKARGSLSSPLKAEKEDNLGGTVHQGYDGDQFVSSAAILAMIDEDTGDNDMPGRLQFYTTADGSNSLSERMRINCAGNIGFGATTFGTGAVGTIGFANGTAPSANVADQHAYYGADIAAGNAAPHWRTENGTVITLRQGVLSSIDTILQQQIFN